MENLRLYYPVKPFSLNQKFGENANPFYGQLGMKGHNGWDFYALDGTPVRATHAGIVTYAGEDGSNGLLVVIRTEEKYRYGVDGAYFKTVYGHLKRGTFNVKAGDRVDVGHILALADNTGKSTGAHLHFGLKPVQQGEADWQWFNLVQDNGYNGAIDPQPYFTGIFAEDYMTHVTLTQKLVAALSAFLAELLKKR